MIDRRKVARAIVNVSEWGGDDGESLSTHELALADAAIASVLEQLGEGAPVLEWLRGQIAKGEAACEAATGRRRHDLAAGVAVLTNAVAAIERGAHLH